MAEKDKTTTTTTDAAATATPTLVPVMIPVESMIIKTMVGDVNLADFAPQGIAYAIAYGVTKSLQDSVSGAAKAIADSTGDDWKAFVKDAGLPDSTDATDDNRKLVMERIVTADRKARLAKILSGDVTVGGPRGPVLRGVDRIAVDIAGDMLDVAAAKKKQPKATGDNRKALIEKLLAHVTHGPDIRAKAQARFDETQNATTDLDLDNL